MNKKELKANVVLGLIFTIRMFGIFIMLPILSNYCINLKHSNNFLIGLALAAYGITQSIFQIPFSFMSDKFGQKKIIILGLILFIIGSLIGATTNSILGIIIARSLQGSGAISSVVITLLLNIVQEKNKTKSMIFIGINITITFIISTVISPIIFYKIGLKWIFFYMSIFALIGIFIVYFFIPNKKYNFKNKIFLKKSLIEINKNKKLIIFNFSIFCLHAILISNFLTVPLMIINSGLEINQHWKIYLIILLFSFLFTWLISNYINKKNKIKKIILSCIIILIISELVFYFSNENFYLIFFAMQLFFISFTTLEFFLPNLVNKEAPKKYKGTTMGIYSTSQFFGVAFGGIISGLIFKTQKINIIFIGEIILSLFWLLLTIKKNNLINNN